MFDGIGKIILWVFAIVGGVVVVHRYGPKVLDAISTKRLGTGAGPNSTPENAASPHAATLVSCGPGGGSSGVDPLQRGVQSSPYFHWCYVARAGDSAGLITERIVGDSARYQELLLANPGIAKKGTPGTVMGADAWDFADGSISEGTQVAIPLTMNAWIDPFGKARGTYLPWPPDPRSIVDATGHEAFVPDTTHAPLMPAASVMGVGVQGQGDGDDVVEESGHPSTPSWSGGYDDSDGYHYVEGASL